MTVRPTDGVERFLADARDEIRGALREEAGRFAASGSAEGLVRTTIERLARYTEAGKMIRGALVLAPVRLSAMGDEPDDKRVAARRAAVAIELIQSFLLIHDDIMDRDDVRRGIPAMHVAYAEDTATSTDDAADAADGKDPVTSTTGAADAVDARRHYGMSQAICAGDVALFWANSLMSGLSVPPQAYAEVSRIVSEELLLVGLAQMQDVKNGSWATLPSRDEVMHVYRYKTARYTFSMPLLVGAKLAGLPEADCAALSEFGEHLGVAFQVRDDELGMYGDEGIGKPVGSDVREGKKTLLFLELIERLSSGGRDAELRRVRCIYGDPTADDGEVKWLAALADSTGARAAAARIAEEQRRLAGAVLLRLQHLGEETIGFYEGLSAYVIDRAK